jgi:archaemetzincin
MRRGILFFVTFIMMLAVLSCHRKDIRLYHYSFSAVSDTIFVQPFFPVQLNFSRAISEEIGDFYKSPVVILPEKKLYSSARSVTGRYSAPLILDNLGKEKRASRYKIIGVTSYDIFCESHGVKEWGIFGLGNCPGNSCVVSDFRLRKFVGHEKAFTVNVVLHELGHNFGLNHCDKDQRCLMNDAKGTIKTLYTEQKWLCPYCRRKLDNCRSHNPIKVLKGHLSFYYHNIKTKVPAMIRLAPTAALTVNTSPRKITDKSIAIATLSLSTGAT